MPKTVSGFIREHRWILAVTALLFAERLYVLSTLGVRYSLHSDDASYVISGITFANTGQITMHGVLSAQIMPGMTVLIGLLSLIFGEGTMLWAVLKLLWIATGSCTAYFIYGSVKLFAPSWCGLLASAFLFLPNFVWMDNLILTETPFILLFTAMIYFTLQMGKTGEKRYFWLCLISYMLALTLKANIAPYPVFAMAYLLLVRYDRKILFRQACILAGAVLVLVIPWSIRNAVQFGAFVPLTYGSGNPALLGTYQGEGFPADEDLDYETHVEAVSRERFAKYYDENGLLRDEYIYRYIRLETDAIKAGYRKAEWRKSDLKSYILSYGYLKPKMMVQSVFYWKRVFNVSGASLISWRKVEWGFCLLAFASAFILKKKRKVMAFLAVLYLGNLTIYAMSFAFDRYAETLITIRYIAVGLGFCLLPQLAAKAWRSIRAYERGEAGEAKNNT